MDKKSLNRFVGLEHMKEERLTKRTCETEVKNPLFLTVAEKKNCETFHKARVARAQS